MGAKCSCFGASTNAGVAEQEQGFAGESQSLCPSVHNEYAKTGSSKGQSYQQTVHGACYSKRAEEHTSAASHQHVAAGPHAPKPSTGAQAICGECALLADLQLVGKLGGKHATAYKAYWRGGVPVCVKITVTQDPSVAAGGQPCGSMQSGQLAGTPAAACFQMETANGSLPEPSDPNMPAAVSRQAMIAGRLCHPRIVQTFDVRCCKLSAAFVAAVHYGHLMQQRSGAHGSGRRLSCEEMLSSFEASLTAHERSELKYLESLSLSGWAAAYDDVAQSGAREQDGAVKEAWGQEMGGAAAGAAHAAASGAVPDVHFNSGGSRQRFMAALQSLVQGWHGATPLFKSAATTPSPVRQAPRSGPPSLPRPGSGRCLPEATQQAPGVLKDTAADLGGGLVKPAGGSSSSAATDATMTAVAKALGGAMQHKGGSQADRPGSWEVEGQWDDFGTQWAARLPPDSVLTWRDLLWASAARPGDYVVVQVMQYCDCGNVSKASKAGLFAPANPEATARDVRQAHRALLRTAREVAEGLAFMHGAGVVHGDLKPSAVMLDSSGKDIRRFEAKVSDFSLSRLAVGSSGHKASSAQGSIEYMAPELIDCGQPSLATDVYAFGITLWVMATGRVPHKGTRPGKLLMQVQNHGLRPEWPQGLMPGLQELYARCVAADPAQRPSSTQVADELGRLEFELRAQARPEGGGSRTPSRSVTPTMLTSTLLSTSRNLSSGLNSQLSRLSALSTPVRLESSPVPPPQPPPAAATASSPGILMDAPVSCESDNPAAPANSVAGGSPMGTSPPSSNPAPELTLAGQLTAAAAVAPVTAAGAVTAAPVAVTAAGPVTEGRQPPARQECAAAAVSAMRASGMELASISDRASSWPGHDGYEDAPAVRGGVTARLPDIESTALTFQSSITPSSFPSTGPATPNSEAGLSPQKSAAAPASEVFPLATPDKAEEGRLAVGGFGSTTLMIAEAAVTVARAVVGAGAAAVAATVATAAAVTRADSSTLHHPSKL